METLASGIQQKIHLSFLSFRQFSNRNKQGTVMKQILHGSPSGAYSRKGHLVLEKTQNHRMRNCNITVQQLAIRFYDGYQTSEQAHTHLFAMVSFVIVFATSTKNFTYKSRSHWNFFKTVNQSIQKLSQEFKAAAFLLLDLKTLQFYHIDLE